MTGAVGLVAHELWVGCEDCGYAWVQHPSSGAAWLRALVAEYDKAIDPDAWVSISEEAGPYQKATWSSAYYAAHVAEAFLLAAARLRLFRVSNSPVLDGVQHSPSHVVGNALVVTGALATASDLLSREIDLLPKRLWGATGILNGVPVTALEVANWAAHEARHHLQDVACAETKVA